MSVGSPGHVYIKKQDIVVIKSPMGPGLEICISKQSSHQEPAVHVFKPCDTISPCVITCTQHTYSTCIYLGLHLPLFFAWLMHYGSTAGNEHCPYIYMHRFNRHNLYIYMVIHNYIYIYVYVQQEHMVTIMFFTWKTGYLEHFHRIMPTNKQNNPAQHRRRHWRKTFDGIVKHI